MTVQSPPPGPAPAGSRCSRLRSLLQSSRLEFFMEAHNGLSARIVEEAGFAGIWASGLAISAQFGVRDNNEASWTQVVDVLEFMADATTLPILLDGDTGYGNFNNMRRLVRKLEQRSVAGVCIEDKVFPKSNSFVGEWQPLADIDEFCGKIKAGRDSRTDPDFCIVARVEALIAGWGLDEALRRAEAYHEAGADAILIHSSSRRPDEIVACAREWADRAPLVIVPTRYYSTPTDVFRRAGISVVIWANPMIRACVGAMQAVARTVHASETLVEVEDQVAPLEEVFRLQGAEELMRAQRVYAGSRRTRAVILAATRGSALCDLTARHPKTMLSVGGRPLLRRLVDDLKRQDIHDIVVVGGYRAETIDVAGIRLLVNPDHASGGELGSLACARDALGDDVLVMYGDLLFRSYVLRDLLDTEGDVVTVVDSAAHLRPAQGGRDVAFCTEADDRSFFSRPVFLEKVAPAAGDEAPHGQWIGMVRFQGQGAAWLAEALDQMAGQAGFEHLGIPDLLNHLAERGRSARVVYIHGHWLDVNTCDDVEKADVFTHPQSGLLSGS